MPRPNGKKFVPGSQRRRAVGRISDGREAWVRFISTEWILYGGGATEEDMLAEDAINETVRLHLYDKGHKKWAFNLTTLTEEELNAFEKFMQYAIDRARPLVIERDKEAQEAMANGDDSYARIYRQVPQLVVRARPEREHDPGLRERSEGVPQVDRSDEPIGTDNSADLQGMGTSMVERVPEDGGSQDHSPQADQPESLGEVG